MSQGTKPVDASMPSNGKESLSTLSAWAKALLRSGKTVKAEDYFSRVPFIYFRAYFLGDCQNRGINYWITHDMVDGYAWRSSGCKRTKRSSGRSFGRWKSNAQSWKVKSEGTQIKVGMQLMERDISVWDVYWRLKRKSNPPWSAMHTEWPNARNHTNHSQYPHPKDGGLIVGPCQGSSYVNTRQFRDREGTTTTKM